MQSATYSFSKYSPYLYETAFFAGALIFSFLVALAVGLWWLEVPGIESVVGYADAKMPLLWPWLALSVAAGAAFALHALWKSPDRNFLAFDDSGLTHVRLGLRRTWPWRDLESIEIRTHPEGEQAARLTVTGKFGWKARIAMFLIGSLASSSRLTVVLPDYYETSIEHVVETLNGYRDRTLGIVRPVKTAEASKDLEEQDPRATVYRITGYKLYTKKNEPLFWLLILVVLGGLWFPEMSSIDLSILAVIVAILVSIAIAVRRIRRGSPADNFLRLDDDGVTHVSWGRVLNWRWSDLPAFEIRGSEKFWSAPPRYRRIVIGKRAEAWRRFRLRPALRDDYDAPLDEIAATLNAYRERALATEPATDGPKGLEPA